MPKPSIYIAQEIAKMLKVEVEMVWKIIKNVNSNDFKILYAIVKKAFRI